MSIGDSSIRKIRNFMAHANLAGLFAVFNENNEDIYYPFTEEETHLKIYSIYSPLVFNLLLKFMSNSFAIDEEILLDFEIDRRHISIVKLNSDKLLELKGFPKNYISDDLNIPEDVKLRLADNSPDIYALKNAFLHIKDTEDDLKE